MMNLSNLNWLAIIVAALSAFILGGLWYSPLLFGKPWMAENKFTNENLKGNQAKIFLFAFLWSFIISFNLALFLSDSDTTAERGIAIGFHAGFGFAAMAIFIIGLFERKTTRYMVINAAYITVALTLMGLILGAWR